MHPQLLHLTKHMRSSYNNHSVCTLCPTLRRLARAAKCQTPAELKYSENACGLRWVTCDTDIVMLAAPSAVAVASFIVLSIASRTKSHAKRCAQSQRQPLPQPTRNRHTASPLQRCLLSRRASVHTLFQDFFSNSEISPLNFLWWSVVFSLQICNQMRDAALVVWLDNIFVSLKLRGVAFFFQTLISKRSTASVKTQLSQWCTMAEEATWANLSEQKTVLWKGPYSNY